MSTQYPIYSIAKDLNIESNKIIIACEKLGIKAKGATKRLNKEELEKVKNYFLSGKNVSDEIVDIKKDLGNTKKSKASDVKTKTFYFANRLISKS